ncbi:Dihydrolipoamide acetyltransferase component of pyruvate dehydrogenase complex OS=Streptomyces tendae OX=1932 GN=GUR47_20710 PE=3 SV=1 [Streptomyces tendae]
MQGGTVTITNVGVFGVDTGTPAISTWCSSRSSRSARSSPPAVGPQGQGQAGRQVTTLALSFDHRLVDGELGSKVLADVAAVLE